MNPNVAKCPAKGPETPPKHTGNHVCMSSSCPKPKFRAGPRRGFALIIGVFLVQRDFSTKSAQNRDPLAAAGLHFDPKRFGVVWSTDTEMNINVAKCPAKGPGTPPKHTGNPVCMTLSCPEQKFRAGPRRGLALLRGVFLVQRDFST